eukprot:CAMPEP_0117023380 /NCGR_PEP_ID=MMETSP0472-20121206/17458_1 /TAXON_ID=693140 ORGANISM="Tiarina fusus, Strain LIS" /NCGR_SAMPLE_ID=MMETSP0472 /ASSEMBLY_ACC=CAM_ASM_000603 /LENGTH=330 /DNA_ID=CAMNT_0004729487 /DNA_START=30 /DNA_END=1022 /DNA_ORIENTATION=-
MKLSNKQHKLKKESSIKFDDADLENGYADEPSITWGPGTKSGNDYDDDDNNNDDDGFAKNSTTNSMRAKFRSKRAQDRFEQATVDALMQRSFHLPQNNRRQDWTQYMANTHPFWALACGDKRGLGFVHRLIVFGTSLMIGFTAVNAAVWWEAQQGTAMPDYNIPYILEGDSNTISLAMLSLWTWMAFVHAVHDCVAWYGCLFSSAGVADGNGRLLVYCSLWFMVWAGAGTTFAALLYGMSDDGEYDYMSILTYTGIELAVSWIVWYPLVATTLFSGILGCNGRVPILGGRRRDLKLEQQRLNCTGIPVTTLESLADYDQSTVANRTVDNK